MRGSHNIPHDFLSSSKYSTADHSHSALYHHKYIKSSNMSRRLYLGRLNPSQYLLDHLLAKTLTVF